MDNIFKKIGFVNAKTKANANTMNTLETNISEAIQKVLLASHPVGSYYWSSNPTNPKDLFGGTWAKVEDRFILAAGSNYTVGSTGGSATVTLTRGQVGSVPTVLEAGGYGLTQTSGFLDRVLVTQTIYPHDNMPPYEVAYCWKRIS